MAFLIDRGTHRARGHGTQGAIDRQAGVKMNDHIAVRRLRLLDEALDALRHIMRVFQLPGSAAASGENRRGSADLNARREDYADRSRPAAGPPAWSARCAVTRGARPRPSTGQ